METSYKRFVETFSNSKNITAIYEGLIASKVALDFDDLLRWQWVQAVSALDKYIHDVIIKGMIDIYNGKRTETQKFKSYPITMELLMKINNSDIGIIELEKEWIKQQEKKSYQTPSNIADGLSLIWLEDHKWSTIASEMNKSEKAVRQELASISIRRNQIVHQGDYPTESSDRQEIRIDDVLDVLGFIELLASAINQCLKNI